MASLHQLNLSDAQHKSVESLLDGLKQQREANIATERSNLEALGNPGDKDYATAVQTAKTLAATSIQRRADVETQIYNLLTAEQKAKLPQVLAELKAKQGERHGAWQDHHHDDKSAS
jgi:Spy/CpxP family protein refolding chaperone